MKKDFYYVISEACIDTKARECVKVCPVDCIYDIRDPELNRRFGLSKPKQATDKVSYPYEALPLAEKPDTTLDWGMLIIDPDACIKCGLCEVACPVKAINRVPLIQDPPFFTLIELIKKLPNKGQLNAKTFVNQF